MFELFSDYLAQKRNFLTQVDARIKILFVIAAIAMTVSSQTCYIPLMSILLVMTGLLSIRIPLGIVLLRVSAPLGVAITLAFIKTFFYGTTILFEYRFLGFHLVGYEEGLYNGFLIMSKVAGATSLVVFLNMTTSLERLLAAGRWFRIPDTWVEICVITYRYIFVLLEDTITILDAQRVRLGYTNVIRGVHSLSTLAGMVIIRAYDQSVATYEAMMVRGYRGKTQPFYFENKFMLKDALAALVCVMILVSFLILNQPALFRALRFILGYRKVYPCGYK